MTPQYRPSTTDRGSLWRKWDLHIHTPASALSNRFSDWDSYIQALEDAGAGTTVLGVTDYCSIEGYKRVQEYRNAGRLKGFQLVLPNIEFRTQPQTAKGRAINLHILVDPTQSDHIEQTERTLSHLKFRYDDNWYACTTAELRALGKAHTPNQTDEWGQFKNGVNNFKPDFQTIQDWLEKEGRWLRKNGLVVMANGIDGPTGLSRDAGFSASRDELYRLADIIFSANSKDRDYFLGKGSDTPEEVVRKTGSLKPCIHGSDAHDEAKLFEPDQKRYCWIKADPTFEGLRQLLHEPEDRVSIGPTAPSPIDLSKIVDSIKLEKVGGWFATSELFLNPGLVGIIGEKGSGKTALAELVAFACAAWKSQGSSASFVNKVSPHLDSLVVIVRWADGHESKARIGAGAKTGLPEVRYLSQDFVEELCTRDLSGTRLINQIEEVVFSYIDEADRLDASSFDGLRRLRTEHIVSRKEEVRERISALNHEIVDLERQIAGRDLISQQLKKVSGDIEAIDAQLPSLQGTVDQVVALELQRLSEILQSKSSQLAVANRRLSRIGTVRERAKDYERKIATAFDELEPLLREIGFTDEQVARYRPQLAESRDRPFLSLADEGAKLVSALRGDAGNPIPAGETIADLQMRIEELKVRLASDQQQRERLLALQSQKEKLTADRQRLEKEIARLDVQVTNALASKKEARWSEYLGYFDLLGTERDDLASLYEPLKQVIADDPTGDKAGFELNVRLSTSQEKWMGNGLDLFDKRRSGLPLTDPKVLRELETTLFMGWRERDHAKIRMGLERLLKSLGNPDLIDQTLVSHANREQVYNWLFATDHVRLEYGLRYRGTDLEVLSPGTRGIVLLVLYLAMDRQDRRPLIIDQPEGNLDNSSVFEALVPFLRKAKQSRQVILVSHNPNLVVTTDADQVIVARAERTEGLSHPCIGYTSGALENVGTENAIRNQTVRLLEGGPKPFKMRENKYSLPRTS